MFDSLIGYFGAWLHWLSLWLGELLMQIQQDTFSTPLLILLGVSFAYGFIHASGPGHGKTLVASYFLSNDKSYTKGFTIALLIAIVHTFSALFITLIGYFAFTTMFDQKIQNISQIAAQLSGGFILALGFYLLYQKIKHYKLIQKPSSKWSTAPISACSCSSCNTKDSTEFTLVVSAGIVPCPGTITIFLFSISLGLYFVGFLSAVAMSLGMGVVIAATALLSTKIRTTSKNKISKQMIYLDFFSVGVIVLLGGILLLIS